MFHRATKGPTPAFFTCGFHGGLGHPSPARDLREHGEQCGSSLRFSQQMQMPLLPTSCWPEHHLSPLGLLTGLEAGKPKIKALADWVCGDSPLPGSQSAHPAVSSHQGRVGEFCGLFFNKGPKFIHKDSTFMTQLPCCSHCSLNSGWARCKLRGWKETQGAVGTADMLILSWLTQQQQ